MYTPIFTAIDQRLEEKKRVIVAIDGPCGAGKTTLAVRLQSVYNCPVIAMDHFFLQHWQRTEERLAEPGGNVDYERVLEQVINPLREGRPFQYQIYDCQADSMSLSEEIPVQALTVVEGSYSHHPVLAEHYDLKVFIKVAPDEQKRRLLKRSGPVMLERFLGEWIPLEEKYFSHFRIEENSDLVVRGAS